MFRCNAAVAVLLAFGLICADATAVFAQSDKSNTTTASSRRTRITVYPNRIEPGPNAKRLCRSWLVQEYRVSGTVIVPRMTCWWE